MTGVAHLRYLTRGQALDALHAGQITADEWEGYAHAWQTTAPRFGAHDEYARHEFTTRGAEMVALALGCCSHTPATLAGSDNGQPSPA